MNYLNSLPTEAISFFFEELPPKDFVSTGATCKALYNISIKIPKYLQFPKLPKGIIQNNALILWQFSYNKLDVCDTNKLCEASILTTACNWYNNNNVQDNVNKIVTLTFKEIYKLNLEVYNNYKKIMEKGDLNDQIGADKMAFSQLITVWGNNFFNHAEYTTSELAEKIINSNEFNSPDIIEAAKLVRSQKSYEDIYNNCVVISQHKLQPNGGMGLCQITPESCMDGI